MSKLTRWTIGFVIPFCFLATAMVQADTEATSQNTSLKTYRDVDGQTYFALSLRPADKEPAQSQRDILLLVDTSASQTGLFREDALEAVDTIVSGLRDGERVNIMAVDLKAVPMTTGFVTPGSKALASGVEALKARTPLGATDLVGGLKSAMEQFKDTDRARAIVYIGDGVSRANLPSLHEFDPLAQQLVDHQISVSSYAVGLLRDIALLAVIANNTGGSVFIDGPAVTAQEAGAASLTMARGTVVWPTKTEWSSSITQAYPVRIPPLRFDRDSILIGTLIGKKTVSLEISAMVAGKAATLSYNLEPFDTTQIDDYTMIPELVATARKTDGIMMPLLGSEALDQARQMFQDSSAEFSKLGKQALARGDREGGVGLLREALRRDPGNSEARALLEENTAVRATSTKGIAIQLEEDPFGDLDVTEDLGDEDLGTEEPAADPFGDTPEPEPAVQPAEIEPGDTDVLPETPTPVPAELIAEPAPVPAPIIPAKPSYEPLVLNGGGPVTDSEFLLNAEEERQLIETMMRTEVTRALSIARDSMRSNPSSTLESLKNLRETIIQSPDLTAGVRAELLDRLQGGLRQATRARIEKDRKDELARANLAEQEARRRLWEATNRQQKVVQQYLDQVNALLDERRYALAEEVALRMRDEAPRMVAPNLALAKTAIGNYQRIRELHELAGRQFAETLYGVEVSHVPFSGDPPIIYPPADEWGPLSERRKAQYSNFDLRESGPAERRISAALKSPANMEFNETPLSEAVTILKDDHDIDIQFDTQALSDENVVPTDETVTLNVSNISLRSALKLLLRDLNLTYVIDNEVLMITSKDKAEETLVTKVYPVGDLVMPINSMMGMMGGMGGGMMGGMGGGMMGGMGGGMGGGMMGGMGGGMGGGMMGGMGGMGGGMMGGMGGMGGGMGGMGGMFDVEDAISLGRSKSSSNTSVQESNAAKVIPQRITVARTSGESVDAAWDRYFHELWKTEVTADEERQNFADVRQTVRELNTEKNFAEVTAVITAALRNGHYQPWMHEVLPRALQALDADDDTVERAFMSSVDLSQNPDQIVLVAYQLSRLGFDERAMQLYRDVANAFPMRPEPYVHALEAAKRIKDEAGIRWACENILAQAWPEEYRHVFDQAVRSAKAALYELEKAGKQSEASELAKSFNEALSRDCVVRVTWTGDADIDLMVEEPSGTVCSTRNKRTTSGGVLLGDSLPNANDKTADGISEVYVCPKGFSGEYRVLVSRIWGDVAAGKVNVEIATNVKTNEDGTTVTQHIQQVVDLREKDAVLTFKLNDGRREEAIEDHVVANAAVKHIEVNRAIAAAQFDRLEDERVAASNSLSELSALATRDPRQAARVQAALRGRGAVGFMPIVMPFPEGTMMLGQAVISADRRYVRVSMSPFFSRIADVQTFNFATGQGGQQQQGGGGAQGGFGAGGFGGAGGLGGGGGGGGGGFGGGGFGGGF